MCQLIETVCIKNGKIRRLDLHNERMNRSRLELFGCKTKLKLEKYIAIPPVLTKEKVKCRITYMMNIESVEFEIYQYKPIDSLKLIIDDKIDYRYKYKDRTTLQNLSSLKENADDILIVKNGLITDTSYANIVFRKDNQWFTPSKPLLHGTRREFYIRTLRVDQLTITPSELLQFSEARIINSMISIDKSKPIPIQNIT